MISHTAYYGFNGDEGGQIGGQSCPCSPMDPPPSVAAAAGKMSSSFEFTPTMIILIFKLLSIEKYNRIFWQSARDNILSKVSLSNVSQVGKISLPAN